MTREELRDYVDKQRALNNIPYHVYSELIDGIDTLEQEPTTNNDLEIDWESYKDVDGNSLDDLILEVLQNNFDCGNTYGYKVADEIIGLLPSVTPQEHKWIPVTERLPEDKQRILVTRKSGTIGYISWNTWWNEQTRYPIDKVIAWMPLPEPYNGGE